MATLSLILVNDSEWNGTLSSAAFWSFPFLLLSLFPFGVKRFWDTIHGVTTTEKVCNSKKKHTWYISNDRMELTARCCDVKFRGVHAHLLWTPHLLILCLFETTAHFRTPPKHRPQNHQIFFIALLICTVATLRQLSAFLPVGSVDEGTHVKSHDSTDFVKKGGTMKSETKKQLRSECICTKCITKIGLTATS